MERILTLPKQRVNYPIASRKSVFLNQLTTLPLLRTAVVPPELR